MTLTKCEAIKVYKFALILLPTMLYMPISHAGEAIGSAPVVIGPTAIDHVAIGDIRAKFPKYGEAVENALMR